MKKLIALCLCLALFLSICGCGAAAGSAAETELAEQSSAEATAESAKEAAEADETAPANAEESDLQPESEVEEDEPAVVYEKLDYTLPLFEEQKELSIFYTLRDTSGINPPSKDAPETYFWARLQENLNVDITFQEPSEANALEVYNLMIASADITDIICEYIIADEASAYSGGYDKAIEDDIYVDLMGYLDYAPNYAYYIMSDADNYKSAITDEGHLGAFLALNTEPTVVTFGTCINEDELAATGLEPPDTIDGWMEMFEALAANGVTYPCAVDSEGSIMNGAFENALGACLDTSFLVDAETNELVFGPTTDETRAYLELFITCRENGWIDPDWTIDYGFQNPNFVSQAIPTTNANAQDIPYYPYYIGFGITACPLVHRDGYGANQLAIDDYTTTLLRTGGGMAISTCCEDIEAAMKLMDWSYSDEGAEICNYGWVEGETYYVEDGKKYVTTFYQEPSDYGFGNKSFYTADGDFGLIYPNVTYEVSGDVERNATDLWTPDPDNDAAIYYYMPDAARLTADEAAEVTTLEADLETYVDSAILRWMSGLDELNDETWNAFVADCSSMQLDTIQAAYEAAFERYLDN